MNTKVIDYCDNCKSIKIFNETDRELLGVFSDYNEEDRPYEYKKIKLNLKCSDCEEEYSTIIEQIF